MVGPFDFIDGWKIGADGYWEPLPCQACGGRKAISRRAVQSRPLEIGYDWWHVPCGRCSGHGLESLLSWLRNTTA